MILCKKVAFFLNVTPLMKPSFISPLFPGLFPTAKLSQTAGIGSLIAQDPMTEIFRTQNDPQFSEDERFFSSEKQTIDSPKKEIFTPTFWTNDEFQKLNLFPWETKYNSMKQQHFRLEVIEARITSGKYDDYAHSAFAPGIERHTDEIDLNNYEKRRLKTYNVETPKNVKPVFWTDRVYDSLFTSLSREESEELSKQMEKYDEEVSIECFVEMRDKQKQQERLKMRHCVTFSALDFATEEDDDQTQWEDADI